MEERLSWKAGAKVISSGRQLSKGDDRSSNLETSGRWAVRVVVQGVEVRGIWREVRGRCGGGRR